MVIGWAMATGWVKVTVTGWVRAMATGSVRATVTGWVRAIASD